MQIGLLGPFEVHTDDGAPADVPGARLRGLLTALALETGRGVPMEAFNHDIWYSNTGWTRPYPGDSKVLLPSQVPGADKKITSDTNGDS